MHLVKPGPVGTYRRRPGQACRRGRARLVGAGPGLPLAGGGGGPGLARVGQAWRESDVAEVARATGTAGAVLKFLFLDLVFERLIEAGAQLSAVFSGVFCFWVYTAQPLVVEELDLPAEPQLCAPEHKSFPAVGRSVFESWSCSALCRPRLLRSDPCSAAPYIPALNRRSTGRIRASARRRLSLRGDLRPLLPLQGFAENAHVDLLRRRRSRGRGADGRMGVELCGRRGRADQRVSAGRARQNPGVLALLLAG